MKKIPTQSENKKGLHQRYVIKKIVPADMRCIETHQIMKETVIGYPQTPDPEFMTIDCDPNAEYFIMRLDDKGSDPKHIAACRIGVNAYADAIKDHLPELSKDLKERYPVSTHSPSRGFTEEEMQHMAIEKYCTPFGRPNPETYAFIEGLKYIASRNNNQ